MYSEKKIYSRRARRGLAALVAAALVAGVAALAQADKTMRADAAAQAAQALKNGVERAIVQCYAVEGAYPQSIEYLENNYGLQINHHRFYVSYEAFASNQLPTVQVLAKS